MKTKEVLSRWILFTFWKTNSRYQPCSNPILETWDCVRVATIRTKQTTLSICSNWQTYPHTNTHMHTQDVLLFIFVETICPLPDGPISHSPINNDNRTWLSFVSLCSIIILIIDSLRTHTPIPWPNSHKTNPICELVQLNFIRNRFYFHSPSGHIWMDICSGDNTDEYVQKEICWTI